MTIVAELKSSKIAVVIPCYKVKSHIGQVLAGIPPLVSTIYAVDDACPEGSGDFIEGTTTDSRVRVLRNKENLGVGGAVMHGYRKAVADGADVIVKVDGDGQMDTALIPAFVEPILSGYADYTKGNRFFDLSGLSKMPAIRIFGNAILSFMSKLSTGYWDVFDPTNGYTAISAKVAALLPMQKISKRYFFETDMLFRLGTYRAVVVDIPMSAHYADEQSNLSIKKILPEFLYKHCRNFVRRIGYNYFLRDMSIASLELVVGSALVIFAITFGGWQWYRAVVEGTRTALGTVMLPTVAIVSGIQFILAFLSFDIANVPRRALHGILQENEDQKSGADNGHH